MNKETLSSTENDCVRTINDFTTFIQQEGEECLGDYLKRRLLIIKLVNALKRCDNPQERCNEIAQQIVVYHQHKIDANEGTCLMDSYHNALYVGTKLCVYMKLDNSRTVCDLLQAINKCEQSSARIMNSIVLDENANYRITNQYRKDFDPEETDLDAVEYFLHHSTKGKQLYSTPIEEMDGEETQIVRLENLRTLTEELPVCAAAYYRQSDALLLLLRYGATLSSPTFPIGVYSTIVHVIKNTIWSSSYKNIMYQRAITLVSKLELAIEKHMSDNSGADTQTGEDHCIDDHVQFMENESETTEETICELNVPANSPINSLTQNQEETHEINEQSSLLMKSTDLIEPTQECAQLTETSNRSEGSLKVVQEIQDECLLDTESTVETVNCFDHESNEIVTVPPETEPVENVAENQDLKYSTDLEAFQETKDLVLEIDDFFSDIVRIPYDANTSLSVYYGTNNTTPVITSYSPSLTKCIQYLLRTVPNIIGIGENFLQQDDPEDNEQGSIKELLDQLVSDKILPANRYTEPAELRHYCRCVIRKRLYDNWELPDGIQQLPVDNKLKNYLDLLID